MKRRRLNVQLTEEQQLLLAVVVVILVAVSTLYCLGLASLALRQTWENTPLPSIETNSPGESPDGTLIVLPLAPTLAVTVVP